MSWYKGNLHCHTTNSDGDSSPKFVANYYRDLGFDFVSITDHNHLTKPAEAGEFDDDFIVIPGDEYTSHVHICGIGIESVIPWDETNSIVDGINLAVDEIKEQEGFSILNHPNWRWAIDIDHMIKGKKTDAFEVYNSGTSCNSMGFEGRLSMDELWDKLLSQEIYLYGVAADDTHTFQYPIDPWRDPPGKGWVCVEAESLTVEHILASLKAGRFYASGGVSFQKLINSKDEIYIEIAPVDKMKYKTTFIGFEGKILDEQMGESARYTIKGDERYVRARVESSGETRAWTQPVIL